MPAMLAAIDSRFSTDLRNPHSDADQTRACRTLHGIGIHALQTGAITPMHIGMPGTMSQFALGDIRAKTRRGLRAVADDGRSAGGLCYGCRVTPGKHGRRCGRARGRDAYARYSLDSERS